MGTSQIKPWRFVTEEEYYKEAIKYMTKHVNSFAENLDVFKEDKKMSILHNISKYNKLYNSGNFKPYNLLKEGVDIVREDVKGWGEFSSATDSALNDIMIRALIGKEFKFNYVATCLLHCNMLITEDFMEDMIYVESNLFKFEEWDDIHVKAVTDCAANSNIEVDDTELLKLYGEDRLAYQTIPIKFNFNDYNGRLSSEFIEKYKNIIKSTKLLSSEEF